MTKCPPRRSGHHVNIHCGPPQAKEHRFLTEKFMVYSSYGQNVVDLRLRKLHEPRIHAVQVAMYTVIKRQMKSLPVGRRHMHIRHFQQPNPGKAKWEKSRGPQSARTARGHHPIIPSGHRCTHTLFLHKHTPRPRRPCNFLTARTHAIVLFSCSASSSIMRRGRQPPLR